jgi:hypothetical protein
MSAFFRLWIRPILLGFVAILIAALVGAGTRLFVEWQRAQRNSGPEFVFGIKSFATKVVIVSIDPVKRIAIVRIYSATTNQVITQRVTLATTFKVESQDPVFENGVLVGYQPRKEIGLSEVPANANGVALLYTDDGGAISIRYLLIGDPFPRP